MKSISLPLVGADVTGAAGEESAPGEKGSNEAFDAVLALVAAQAATLASAPKANAPSAPLQRVGELAEGSAAPVTKEADARNTVKLTGNAAVASAAFAPWLAPGLASAQEAPAPSAEDEHADNERLEFAGAEVPPSTAQDPRLGLPASAAAMLAPARPPVTPQPVLSPTAAAVDASTGSATTIHADAELRRPAIDALSGQRFQHEMSGAEAAMPVQTAPLAPPIQAPRAPEQMAASKVSEQATEPRILPKDRAQAAIQGAAAQALSAERPAEPSDAAALPPQATRTLLSEQLPAGARVAPQLSVQTPRLRPEAVSQQVLQARVVVVQGVEHVPGDTPAGPAQALTGPAQVLTGPSQALTGPSQALTGPSQALTGPSQALTPEVEQPAAPEAAPGRQLEEAPAASEQRPGDSSSQVLGEQGQAQPGFERHAPEPMKLQDTEVQGARGLEAVVASLLRAGSQDARDSGATARLPTRGVVQPTPETVAAASASAARVKLAQGVAATPAALDEAQRLRDEETAAGELLELPVAHAGFQPELAARKDAGVVQSSAVPLPVLPQTLDPDLQPGNMGQGLGAASISIDHPELGAMDLLVQNQNGRIEVRAVLETPHAARVLRAHESALRYGIQQAGMTFGALRVRARTGDGETVKARDNAKRRRDHEWEA